MEVVRFPEADHFSKLNRGKVTRSGQGRFHSSISLAQQCCFCRPLVFSIPGYNLLPTGVTSFSMHVDVQPLSSSLCRTAYTRVTSITTITAVSTRCTGYRSNDFHWRISLDHLWFFRFDARAVIFTLGCIETLETCTDLRAFLQIDFHSKIFR